MITNLGIKPHWQTVQIQDIDELKIGQLHVWWIPLRLSPIQAPIAKSWLNDIQCDKYARRATPKLKQAYLAGRFYLIKLLAAYAKLQPEQVTLTYSRLNKPSLDNNRQSIKFNFTDTIVDGTPHALFAFSKVYEVGVDIEGLARRSDFLAIARRKFTPNEMVFITDTRSGEINPERFLAIWTRKEAFGKATGLGINYRMNQQDLASETPELDFFDQHNQAWKLLQLQLGDTLIASVAHAQHAPLTLKAYQLADQSYD